MKNIHILPTDKPSIIYKSSITSNFALEKRRHILRAGRLQNQHIYITSDEKFKQDEYITDGIEVIKASPKLVNAQGLVDRRDWKKIVLTTDQDLISDGVQAIDDDFLEWFVKNPSCEFVEVEKIRVISYSFPRNAYDKYRITIPKEESKFEDSIENSVNIMSIANSMFGKKEEPKQETIDEAASRLLYSKYPFHPPQDSGYWKDMFLEGVKWLEQRMYSKEDLMEFFIEGYKQRAESSNMIFDDASRLYAIHLFNEQIKKK